MISYTEVDGKWGQVRICRADQPPDIGDRLGDDYVV